MNQLLQRQAKATMWWCGVAALAASTALIEALQLHNWWTAGLAAITIAGSIISALYAHETWKAARQISRLPSITNGDPYKTKARR